MRRRNEEGKQPGQIGRRLVGGAPANGEAAGGHHERTPPNIHGHELQLPVLVLACEHGSTASYDALEYNAALAWLTIPTPPSSQTTDNAGQASRPPPSLRLAWVAFPFHSTLFVPQQLRQHNLQHGNRMSKRPFVDGGVGVGGARKQRIDLSDLKPAGATGNGGGITGPGSVNPYTKRQYSARYYDILSKRRGLPVYEFLDELSTKVKKNQVCVWSGWVGGGREREGGEGAGLSLCYT